MATNWEKIDSTKAKHRETGVIVDVNELKKTLKVLEEKRDEVFEEDLDDETIRKAVEIHNKRQDREMFESAVISQKEQIKKFEEIVR